MRRGGLLLCLLAACSGGDPLSDAGSTDALIPRDIGSTDVDRADLGPDDATSIDADVQDTGDVDSGSTDAGPPARPWVRVTLDGVPQADVTVTQGGRTNVWLTDERGYAAVMPVLSPEGPVTMSASHPEARILGVELDSTVFSATIALQRYDTSDNPAYIFQDPGEPGRRPDTRQCGHCHRTINDDWSASIHRSSAKNPAVHDVYGGTATGLDEAACTTAGGTWALSYIPGSTQQAERCVFGDGVTDLNAGNGGCADCHAPGMNGQLFGRDLANTQELGFEYGVHCDVCHRVEDVNEGGEPAFGGWLAAMRPSEPGPVFLGAGGRLPLTFGPSHDSPNIRMGSVQRDHFRQATICGGCHQLEQAVFQGTIEPTRWPSGKLPIHSTFEEWKAGPLVDAAPCQSCHMPPDPLAENAGDLQLNLRTTIGIPGGYPRPPGSVRRHTFRGPRSASDALIRSAGALFVRAEDNGTGWTVTVTTQNVGAGHAIPTGEPLRSLLLSVEAQCNGQPLEATGGDVIPFFGGAVRQREAGQDWSDWPEAEVGDRIRVVNLGAPLDYNGFGPFGDGRFSAAQKNLPREEFVAEVVVQSTLPFTTAPSLPAGDRAYLVKTDLSAGQPGHAFARVLADQSGTPMVPHHLAADVLIDNRLMPRARWTSTHRFAACAAPSFVARLIHRNYPPQLATRRGWTVEDKLMTEVRR